MNDLERGDKYNRQPQLSMVTAPNLSHPGQQYLLLLLPVVVAAHNFEELWQHKRFVAVYYPHVRSEWVAAGPIRMAATLLAGSVLWIVFEAFRQGTAIWSGAARVTVIAFAINACSHIFLSVRRRELVPGTWTAVFLVLPYSCLALLFIPWSPETSGSQLPLTLLLGLLIGPVAVVCFLAIGNAVWKGVSFQSKRNR